MYVFFSFLPFALYTIFFVRLVLNFVGSTDVMHFYTRSAMNNTFFELYLFTDSIPVRLFPFLLFTVIFCSGTVFVILFCLVKQKLLLEHHELTAPTFDLLQNLYECSERILRHWLRPEHTFYSFFFAFFSPSKSSVIQKYFLQNFRKKKHFY